MAEWLNEALYPDWGQRFRVVRTLAHVRSPYQDIQVIESASHGRVLVLDGAIQITEADEFVYQEMLAHVPLLAHGAARRVLIIGAGDGGVLRRVLQHRGVEHAVMVEIDGEVIRLSREHLPGIGGDAWTDPRAEIIVGDGIAYVAAAAPDSFDVIIVDSTDPVGVGEALFTDAEGRYNDGARFRLHYVTAREMFNVIRATEDGAEDGAHIRDWVLPPPHASVPDRGRRRPPRSGSALAP